MIKQLVRPLITGKGPNFSNLTAKECGIGDYRLGYKLPGNAIDIGRPKKPRPAQVNLGSDIFNSYGCEKEYNRTFVRMEFEWWAYKGSFLQGYFGQLSRVCLYIDVNRVEHHTPLQEGCLDSLESYLKRDYWEYYETERNNDGNVGVNWEKRNKREENPHGYGLSPLLVKLPETYERLSLNGVQWLKYCIDGEGIPGTGITYYWAYPLTNNYYLTFNFRMTSEAGDKKLSYQRMYEDAKRIMSMVELIKV
ncbi:hypothetical protein [Hahella sp. NBU794]|uniref:hypothetical protein n=1 Tax=Hahella sp. NBU794 TaxID=3422590 RepID=UPI003D6DAD2D